MNKRQRKKHYSKLRAISYFKALSKSLDGYMHEVYHKDRRGIWYSLFVDDLLGSIDNLPDDLSERKLRPVKAGED